MASQRATDRAVYELLARSPELQGRLEAFLRDHPDQMPARQRQVLMRSVEKAARDPRVGLALRDAEGDCEWWPEPVVCRSRGPFAVPAARGKFDLEADCRRAKPQAAAVPEPVGWRWLVAALWVPWVLTATTLCSAARHVWQAHVASTRVCHRVGRACHPELAIAIVMLQGRLGSPGVARHVIIPQPHTTSRGPPLAALLRTFTRWPALRTVRTAKVRRQRVAVRG